MTSEYLSFISSLVPAVLVFAECPVCRAVAGAGELHQLTPGAWSHAETRDHHQEQPEHRESREDEEINTPNNNILRFLDKGDQKLTLQAII